MDARTILDKIDLAYLVADMKYWITQEIRVMHGVNPNHLCIDKQKNIALGILFKSSNGPDYPLGLRLLELLKKLKADANHDCYVATQMWDVRRNAHILHTNPLSTIATRVAGAKWMPPTNGYISPYVFLTEELQLANMNRATLPF
jgi:hypothetical protein